MNQTSLAEWCASRFPHWDAPRRTLLVIALRAVSEINSPEEVSLVLTPHGEREMPTPQELLHELGDALGYSRIASARTPQEVWRGHLQDVRDLRAVADEHAARPR